MRLRVSHKHTRQSSRKTTAVRRRGGPGTSCGEAAPGPGTPTALLTARPAAHLRSALRSRAPGVRGSESSPRGLPEVHKHAHVRGHSAGLCGRAGSVSCLKSAASRRCPPAPRRPRKHLLAAASLGQTLLFHSTVCHMSSFPRLSTVHRVGHI